MDSKLLLVYHKLWDFLTGGTFMKNQLLLFLCLFTSTVYSAAPESFEGERELKERIEIHLNKEVAFVTMSPDKKTINVVDTQYGERVLAELKEGNFFKIANRTNTMHFYAKIGQEKFGFATPVSTLFKSTQEDKKEMFWWMLDENCGPVIPYLE